MGPPMMAVEQRHCMDRNPSDLVDAAELARRMRAAADALDGGARRPTRWARRAAEWVGLRLLGAAVVIATVVFMGKAVQFFWPQYRVAAITIHLPTITDRPAPRP